MEVVSFIISFLLYLLVAAPVCLVLHELGHAAMILALTRQRAVFRFGGQGKGHELRLGRITAVIHREIHALFFCSYRLQDKNALTWNQDLWITLGGPLSSLLFTLLFAAIWWRTATSDPWSALTWINLFNFIISGVPGYYPKVFAARGEIANDGLQIVRLVRSRAG